MRLLKTTNLYKILMHSVKVNFAHSYRSFILQRGTLGDYFCSCNLYIYFAKLSILLVKMSKISNEFKCIFSVWWWLVFIGYLTGFRIIVERHLWVFLWEYFQIGLAEEGVPYTMNWTCSPQYFLPGQVIWTASSPNPVCNYLTLSHYASPAIIAYFFKYWDNIIPASG